MYFKAKRIPKIGDSIFSRLNNKQLWRGIEASQVGEIFKKLSEELNELKGSQMVSWCNGVLKIKVGSSVQRQEIILKQTKIINELRKKGVTAKEIKTVFR